MAIELETDKSTGEGVSATGSSAVLLFRERERRAGVEVSDVEPEAREAACRIG